MLSISRIGAGDSRLDVHYEEWGFKASFNLRRLAGYSDSNYELGLVV